MLKRYSRYNDGTDQLVQDSTMKITNVQILSEYVHLDQEERRLFASNVQEYLITQVQSSISNPVNLYNPDPASYKNHFFKSGLF